jgi:hypothetical protein
MRWYVTAFGEHGRGAPCKICERNLVPSNDGSYADICYAFPSILQNVQLQRPNSGHISTASIQGDGLASICGFPYDSASRAGNDGYDWTL